MDISYKKLWVLLIEKDITRAQMRRDLKIATGTMSKLNKGEEVALSVLLRICEYLDCDIGDICSVVKKKKEDARMIQIAICDDDETGTLRYLIKPINTQKFDEACSTKNEIPDVVKNTNGGEKWETKIDYASNDNWLAKNDTGKDVDVIYFYPTTFHKGSEDAPDISDIDDAGMRVQAQVKLKLQASVFEEDCNIYAPYYRQISAPYGLTLRNEEADALLRYSASQDPSRALDYYFEHYNNGKPFILAGHSQGSQILTVILSDYMKAHPEYYDRMIAAHVIGYSVTEDYMKANPHLNFAEGADDTGVIISYNTEGPGNKDKHNAVVTKGAISINPLNWKRDETYAAVSENKGSLIAVGELAEGMADARVDLERGVVVCESVDPAVYGVPETSHALFGPESFHNCDYGLYYMNLRENVKVRITAFNQ